MTTFQTMVSLPELSEVTLQSRYKFPTTSESDSNDTGSLIEPTSAAIVASWSTFSESGREIAYRALQVEGIVGTVILELESLARATERIMQRYTDATGRAPTYT